MLAPFLAAARAINLSLKMAVKVLIVDDQAPFREAARAVVDATDGFQVVGESESGEEAVVAAGQLHPDLVLMDVNLPGINGLEATRRIRQESNGVVVVVLLSTYEESDYASRASEAGATTYISKSKFEPQRLVSAWQTARQT